MEKHNLINEFPEYKEKIHDLKTTNHHFKNLFEKYSDVEKEIHRIETGAEHTTDEVLNALRIRRVHLKDELYTFLK